MTAPDYAPVFAAIDAFVADRLYADGTPGLALALTDRDRTLRVATYGVANLASNTPVTPDLYFETGSIGKTYTADALLVLAERGLLDLDAPVTDYLPWFSVRSRFGPITLHHLLTHTAGIVAGPDGSPSGIAEVWQLRETEATSPPGSRFHYSNVGYKALGLVLAAVADRPYPEAIQKLVLDPLGQETTVPAITNDLRQRLAVGYTGLYDDRPFHPRHPLIPATWLETDTGDGCLATTPADLAAYARFLLNRGRGPAGPLYGEASFARKTAIHAATAPGVGYGYGIVRREANGRVLLGHGGGMVGYFASLLTDQDAGLGVAVMINGPGAPGAIASHALALLRAATLGQPMPVAEQSDAPLDSIDLEGVYHRREGSGYDEVAVEPAPGGQGRPTLRFADQVVGLNLYDDDLFLVDHPAWSRFLLAFERSADDRVIGFAHGGTWYERAGASVEPAPFLSPTWRTYAGYFRSHNPWCPAFRIVPRRGQLWLIFPVAPDGFEDEQPLTPIDPPGAFRAGSDPEGPETVVFDVVVDGRALRATLSGCPYWRVEGP